MAALKLYTKRPNMLTLSSIKGVGDATIKKLKELDITSVFGLLSFLPSKYISLSDPISVKDAAKGQLALFEGRVEKVSTPSKGGKKGFFVGMEDCVSSSGLHFRVTIYNMPFLHDGFKEGQRYRILGRLSNNDDVFEIVNPQLEKLEKISKLQGVYPVYPLGGVMGQNAFKNVLYGALDALDPDAYTGRLKVVNADMARAFMKIHRPKTVGEGEEALDFLCELDVAVTLAIYKKLRKNSRRQRAAFYRIPEDFVKRFSDALAFTPTKSQISAFEDILEDLASDAYMSRIISGDVGSGKTAVAFFAMCAAAASGRQAALLVPTEILAGQHAKAFENLAEKLGISFALLTASAPKAEKERVLAGLKDGSISCVIGTQSLIGEGVRYKDLAIAAIDEQHKFGVNERRAIEDKGAPDVLSLTATPIPRSMALTFYDDVAISSICKREDAKTNICTVVTTDLDGAVAEIAEEARQGKQAFVVCPAIKDAEGYELMSVQNFMKIYAGQLRDVGAAVLHGGMSAEDKSETMRKFVKGEIKVLVATTVVEVGVDTKASNILIVNADRFGLASLHQLRGRVGRDGSPAKCLLHSLSSSEKAVERLSTLEKSNDGQYLAEVDFSMRGSGDFLGVRQSGVSYTPMFGLKLTATALRKAKIYEEKKLSGLTLQELISLTRRSEQRVREFVDALNMVTLNS